MHVAILFLIILRGYTGGVSKGNFGEVSLALNYDLKKTNSAYNSNLCTNSFFWPWMDI